MDAKINQIGTYHLADNPHLYELQRNNTFTFIVTGIDNLLKAGTQANDSNNYITNAADVLRLSVSQSSIPMFTQETITVRRGNSVMKFAGVPSFSDGSITVNDYIGADSKSALMAWQNLSYDVATEKVGLAKDYKKTCYLCEYTPDFNKLVRTWKMLGCFVSGLSEEPFNAEDGSSKKQITATISFDKAFMEVPEEE